MEASAVDEPLLVVVRYDDQNRRGFLLVEAPTGNTVWERLKQSASVIGSDGGRFRIRKKSYVYEK